ncbi:MULTISPECIES: hypothetical protein [unclassified Microcoleus]
MGEFSWIIKWVVDNKKPGTFKSSGLVRKDSATIYPELLLGQK